MQKKIEESLAPSTANTLLFLSGIEELKDFTLVGGSALSIYLQHRISEDLDFFTWEKILNPDLMDSILNKIANNQSLKILNTYSDGMNISINDTNVTFFSNQWDKIKERKNLYKNLYIGSMELLTAMKTNALSLRAKFRDYYDLYVISQKVFDIKKIHDISLEYIPGMSSKIFAMQLVYTDDIDDENIDHLKPKFNVSLDDIRIHFENEIKKIID